MKQHGFSAMKCDNLVALRHRVRSAWSPLEAQLNGRHDRVRRLVETMNGAAESAPEALEAVMTAFRQVLHAGGIPARGEAENELSEALRGFFAMAGACPAREVNPDVRAAQEELIAAE